jgi:hypothetical protein
MPSPNKETLVRSAMLAPREGHVRLALRAIFWTWGGLGLLFLVYDWLALNGTPSSIMIGSNIWMQVQARTCSLWLPRECLG